MSSDTEQDQHSIWNGRFKANPKEGKFFLEIVDKLGAQFDGMPVEEILQTFWGEPRDVLEKLIKKANKREKKEEAKFEVKTLKRAPSANILFQKDYKAKCDAKGIKFDLKNCAEEYKKLNDKDKAKYKKEAQRLKDEYNTEYARLRAEAIKNGDFPEDKPKRPLSGFLRYIADVRAEISEKYKDVEDRKSVNAQIVKDAGEMWQALTDKEKAPYELEYKKEKEIFEQKLKEWESKELERRKKNGAEPAKPDTVKIETAGTKKEPVPVEPEPKQEPKKISAKIATKTVSTDSEDNEEQEKPKPKKVSVPKKQIITEDESTQDEEVEIEKPKPKKVSVPKKQIISEDDATQDEEVEKPKPKAKTSTKTK